MYFMYTRVNRYVSIHTWILHIWTHKCTHTCLRPCPPQYPCSITFHPHQLFLFLPTGENRAGVASAERRLEWGQGPSQAVLQMEHHSRGWHLGTEAPWEEVSPWWTPVIVLSASPAPNLNLWSYSPKTLSWEDGGSTSEPHQRDSRCFPMSERSGFPWAEFTLLTSMSCPSMTANPIIQGHDSVNLIPT